MPSLGSQRNTVRALDWLNCIGVLSHTVGDTKRVLVERFPNLFFFGGNTLGLPTGNY